MTIGYMKFINPTFHEGINIAVRNTSVHKIADEFVAMDAAGNAVAICEKVIDRNLYLSSPTLADLLVYEHDPECRTIEGLRYRLQEVYGDTFGYDDFVRVIGFVVEPREEGTSDES